MPQQSHRPLCPRPKTLPRTDARSCRRLVREAAEGASLRRSAPTGRLWTPAFRRQARHDLLEILEERYGRRSTLITSQLPVADWHTLIGHATYADAILDRLVHNAHRIELKGDSLRRANANPAS